MSKRRQPPPNHMPPAPRAPAGARPVQATLTVAQAMNHAIAAYSAGDWGKAEQLGRLILSAHRDHFDALNLLGVIMAQTRRTLEAAAFLGRAVAAQPRNAAAHNNYGNVLKELRRFDNARASYERALKIDPNFADAHYNRGVTLHELGLFEEARASYERGLQLRPDHADAYCSRGNSLLELERFEEAIEDYSRALKIRPQHAQSHFNRANALQKLKRLDEALDGYAQALTMRPDFSEALYNRANALHDLGRFEEALTAYESALKCTPNNAEAHGNRGNTLQALKRYQEALESYDRSVKLAPDDAEAYFNRGNALQALKRNDEALESYERAVQIRPDFADAHYNRGNALKEIKRLEAALDAYDRALQYKPDFADAHFNRGTVLKDLNRPEAAQQSYDRALRINPQYAEAYNSLGNLLQVLNRFEEALDSYDRALAIWPDYADAYANRGIVLGELRRYEDALGSFERALWIKPDSEWVFGPWLHTKMQLCEWGDFEAQIGELTAKILHDKKASPPFPVLALVDDPALQRRAVEAWVAGKYPVNRSLPPIARGARHEKIRIGYFSGDFRNHPVSMLTADLIETHDRSRFEVIAFSFGADPQDELRRRMERAFDRFIDVRDKSDAEIAQLARQMEIDIAVDLGGFTDGGRPSLFALRAAPLQVSYIGYLGTMGADYMDYLIADATTVPEEHRQHYAEKIAYLPSYQANDSKRVIADKRFTREELGLPSTGFVFCCFNAIYKITPQSFSSWMRILGQVEGSVLFLLAENGRVERNLRNEAGVRGIAAERLIFGKRLPVPEYLARYRSADLFLDTLPYNAGTTASDALWAGLPVLTQRGESFASRIAASLLNAIGLPELITTTSQQYESTAIELANNPGRLAAIRENLQRNITSTPLFDTRLFARHIEAAYAQMYERYLAGLSPEHLLPDAP